MPTIQRSFIEVFEPMTARYRLAVLTTHPVQYYAPLFHLLANRGNIELKVFYSRGKAAASGDYDPGFGRNVKWDQPLLDGYTYEWADNRAVDPGTHHFRGIITPGLNERIADFRPNVLLVFGWAYQAHLSALLYFYKKIRIFFRGDSTLLDELSLPRAWIRKISLTWIYRHVDLALYTGTANRAYFAAYGFQKKRLAFAPHAVDNSRFADDTIARSSSVRSEAGIPANAIVVLYAGKFQEKKAPELLLKTFLKLDHEHVHLLMVGSGYLESQLKALAFNEPKIHFLAMQNQSQMPRIYNAADLFCLPSKGPGETWGLSVNEAMSAGKAILVSDKVGCAVDLLHSGVNGAIFKSGSEQDLLRNLQLLVSDRARLKQMGDASLSIIKDWNLTSVAQAIEIAMERSLNDE